MGSLEIVGSGLLKGGGLTGVSSWLLPVVFLYWSSMITDAHPFLCLMYVYTVV